MYTRFAVLARPATLELFGLSSGQDVILFPHSAPDQPPVPHP